MTFKIGDKVRRMSVAARALDYNGMMVGDWDVITNIEHFSIDLKTYGRGHDPKLFELVEEAKPAPTPHKWAKEIKAWADGAEIEIRSLTPHGWTPWQVLDRTPGWFTIPSYEYRIKPEKKPDVVLYGVASRPDGRKAGMAQMMNTNPHGADVSFTFDGETGKLKAVELIN